PAAGIALAHVRGLVVDRDRTRLIHLARHRIPGQMLQNQVQPPVLALPLGAEGAAGVSQSGVDRQTTAPPQTRILLTLDHVHVHEAALRFGGVGTGSRLRPALARTLGAFDDDVVLWAPGWVEGDGKIESQ